MGLFTKERAVDTRCYIFDDAGGMRDQLEQTILQELQEKKYPLRATIDTVKSGGLIFGSKDQCVVIDLGNKTRIVIANTTVGTYLYVEVYLLIPFIVTNNAPAVVEPIDDIFRMQQRNALYSAAIAATESSFQKLNLKLSNSGYTPNFTKN